MTKDHLYFTFCETESFVSQELQGDGDVVQVRSLIEAVREKSIVYKKKHPDHLNRDKVGQAWKSIGQGLPTPLPGKDACAAFYKLRQRFGKERRKVKESQPRSAAGAGVPTYTPDWIHYQDMMWLSDHIQPRNSASTNYQGRAGASGTSQFTQAPGPLHQHTAPLQPVTITGQPNKVVQLNKVVQSPSINAWNTPGPSHISTPSISRSSTPSSTFELPMGGDGGIIDGVDIDDIDCSQIEVPTDTSSQAGSLDVGASSKTWKVPQCDSSYKKRRMEVDTINKSLIESNKGFAELAATVGAALQKATAEGTQTASAGAASATFSTEVPVQTMMSTLGLALSKVNEDDHLDGLIELLQVVRTNYIKK